MKIPEAVRERIKPEGLALGAALEIAAPAALPVQTALIFLLNDAGKSVPSETLRTVAISVFGLNVALGWLITALTLRKYNYASDLSSTILQVGTGNPWLSSLGGLGIGLFYGTLFNPNDWIGIGSLLFGRESARIFDEDLIAKSIVAFTYVNSVNFLINFGMGKKLGEVGDRMAKKIGSLILPK